MGDNIDVFVAVMGVGLLGLAGVKSVECAISSGINNVTQEQVVCPTEMYGMPLREGNPSVAGPADSKGIRITNSDGRVCTYTP